MRQLPDTTADRKSLHTSGTDEELTIFIPGDPEQYRLLTALGWSFDEKPYPKGYFEIRAPQLGLTLARFDITKSGSENLLFNSSNAPYSPKGLDILFVLGGKGGNKTFVIQLA